MDIAANTFLNALYVLTDRKLEGRSGDGESCGTRVYHIVSKHKKPEWMDLLGWLRRAREDFEVLGMREWLRGLEELERAGVEHPSLRLLGH